MNKPHKHAEVIKAWADGAEVQFRDPHGKLFQSWTNVARCPSWDTSLEYRVKLQTKKIRVALHKNSGSAPTAVLWNQSFEFVENRQDFIKWISDVIEYEE